jgi:hypothetical protein
MFKRKILRKLTYMGEKSLRRKEAKESISVDYDINNEAF